MGNTFVGVGGSGFSVSSPAVVTGTTPKGTMTVNAMTDNGGRVNTSIPVPAGFQGPMNVRVNVGPVSATATATAGAPLSADPASDAGVRPLTGVKCSVTADVDQIPDTGPGDVVCLTGNSSSRLVIKEGGTAQAPIVYSGGGSSTVRGIDVAADNVVVEGFTSTDAASMGASLRGNNVTFQNNTIKHPVNAGDDTDGLRFWGNSIRIVHNTITDINDGADCNDDGCGNGPHPDCMQTYYNDTNPTSSDITIEGNRCENAASQCLIGEGPVLPGEGVNGPGQSVGWTFYDNYCQTGAVQSVQFKDVKNVTVVDNFFDGGNNKAISLAFASTGAHVGGNKLSPRIGKLITFDDGDEAPGYIGPTPGQ
ncbi:MAG TPA: hypothetical protein VGE11_01545 [Pseudonocardia sp.]